MVVLHMIDIWRETVDELGGLKGFACIFAGMFVFTLVVHWTVAQAGNRRAFKRMNLGRARKCR